MSYEQILFDVSDRVATITLNRPEQLNAFTRIMELELREALVLKTAFPSLPRGVT